MKANTLLSASLFSLASTFATVGVTSLSYAPNVLAEEAPTYTPPAVGAPTRRVGGGTRSEGTPPLLAVLAPETTGYTTKEQPTLYWATSKAINAPFAITINENDPDMPVPITVASKEVPVSVAGIQSFNLAEHGITLETGKDYEWTVTIVSDDAAMSTAFTAGSIKIVAPSDSLTQRLKGAADEEKPYVYAEEGIWYDAMQALSALIKKSPEKSADLQRARLSMLKQVNLVPEGDSFKEPE